MPRGRQKTRFLAILLLKTETMSVVDVRAETNAVTFFLHVFSPIDLAPLQLQGATRFWPVPGGCPPRAEYIAPSGFGAKARSISHYLNLPESAPANFVLLRLRGQNSPNLNRDGFPTISRRRLLWIYEHRGCCIHGVGCGNHFAAGFFFHVKSDL
jgi:hypothetical protein